MQRKRQQQQWNCTIVDLIFFRTVLLFQSLSLSLILSLSLFIGLAEKFYLFVKTTKPFSKNPLWSEMHWFLLSVKIKRICGHTYKNKQFKQYMILGLFNGNITHIDTIVYKCANIIKYTHARTQKLLKSNIVGLATIAQTNSNTHSHCTFGPHSLKECDNISGCCLLDAYKSNIFMYRTH